MRTKISPSLLNTLAYNHHIFMNTTTFPRSLCDALFEGDCSEVMQRIEAASIDLVVTDPPYIARYTDRFKRRVQNDDNWRWIAPAFSQVYRVLKPDTYCVSFYGWQHIEKLMTTWKLLGPLSGRTPCVAQAVPVEHRSCRVHA
jgi:hypothetical protein